MKVNAELSSVVRNGSYQQEQEPAQDYHYFPSSSWRQRQQSRMDISQRLVSSKSFCRFSSVFV